MPSLLFNILVFLHNILFFEVAIVFFGAVVVQQEKGRRSRKTEKTAHFFDDYDRSFCSVYFWRNILLVDPF